MVSITVVNITSQFWILESDYFIVIAFFFFLQLHLQHTKVPWGARGQIGAETKATAMATRDPSSICNLHHSL